MRTTAGPKPTHRHVHCANGNLCIFLVQDGLPSEASSESLAGFFTLLHPCQLVGRCSQVALEHDNGDDSACVWSDFRRQMHVKESTGRLFALPRSRRAVRNPAQDLYVGQCACRACRVRDEHNAYHSAQATTNASMLLNPVPHNGVFVPQAHC